MKMAFSCHIIKSSLIVSAVVAIVLNIINQGDAIISATDISWPHLILNFFVPYCVASYSAAKNEIRNLHNL